MKKRLWRFLFNGLYWFNWLYSLEPEKNMSSASHRARLIWVGSVSDPTFC